MAALSFHLIMLGEREKQKEKERGERKGFLVYFLLRTLIVFHQGPTLKAYLTLTTS